jgi:NAD(P)H-dependent FMN reductase
MKIMAISGSTRKDSTNTALLLAMKALAPAGIELSVFHRLDTLPVFSPDLEGEHTPAAVRDFMDLISNANGLIIASPEYVRGIPGGLKNAIDWMVSRFEIVGKPIALAHASHRGDDMLAALRLVLSTVSTGFQNDLFLRIPLVGKPPAEISMIMHQPEWQSQVTAFLSDFAARSMTLKALADVDAGRVIDHHVIQAWADSLTTDK